MAAGISFTITALDNTASGIDAINKRLETFQNGISRSLAPYAASLENVQRSIGKLAGLTGLKSVARDLRNVGQFAASAAEKVAKFGSALGLAIGALSIAGLAKMAESWSAFGSNLKLNAQALGTTVERLGALEIASRLAGRSAGDMDASLASARSTMQAAIYGGNPEAANVFRSLGIDIGNFRTGARDAISILPKIAEMTKRYFDINPETAAHFLDVTGYGRQMLNVFKDGAAGLQGYLEQARQLAPLTAAEAEEAFKFGVAQTKLSIAFERVGYSLIGAFGPQLTEIMDRIRTFVTNHIPQINAGMGQFSAWLGRTLTTENLDKVFAAIERIAQWVERLIGSLSSMQNMGVAEIFARAFGVDPDGWLMRVARLMDVQVPAPGASPTTMQTGPGAAQGQAERPWWRRAIDALPSLVPFSGVASGPQGPGVPLMPGGAPGARPTDSRGIRNHNLTNMGLVRGDAGLIGTDGREGIYRDDAAGIAGAERNLLRYRARGLTTLASIIGEWSPPGENDTPRLIREATQRTGWDPNAQVDVRDPAQAARLMSALIAQEVGRTIDPAVLNRGIADGLGLAVPAPPAPGAPALPVPGAPAVPVPASPVAAGADVTHRLHVTIDNRNAPPGQTVRITPVDPSTMTVDPASQMIGAPPRREMPMQPG